MKNYLKVDVRNRRLIMDRTFDKNCRIVGSNEYDLLQRAIADYPQFTVTLKHIKTNPEKRVYKNLTYDYMREYISQHPHAKERMTEFNEMTLRAKCHKEKYAKVKEWFLAAYPNINDFTPADYKDKCMAEKADDDYYEVIEEALETDSLLKMAS